MKVPTRLFAAIILCITLTLSVVAQQSGSATISAATATSTASRIVAANSSISSVLVTNSGSVIAYVGEVTGVTASTGTPVYPKTYVQFDNVNSALYAITSSSTTSLRIVLIKGGGKVSSGKLETAGASNNATNTVMGMSDGTNIVDGSVLVYNLSTAITPNSTTTATAAGTLAVTSNATGRGVVFRSDASKWQLLSTYSDVSVGGAPVTIATTSTSDIYFVAPCAGTITGIDFTSIDALAASDTNYITYTAVNLGQSGVGTTALLAASDANTTKTTGGTALTALARRSLSLTATGADLIVAKGDVIRVRATATGTLAGTVTGSRVLAYITRLS